MRQPYDFEPSGENPDAAGKAGAERGIDLDRVVWDPEYRDQVLEDMRATG